MEYVHPIHTEALFSKLPINTGKDKVLWIKHQPSVISIGGYSSVQFHIPGTETQYTDLSHAELQVTLKTEDSD